VTEHPPKPKPTLDEALEELRRAFLAPFLPVFEWLLADKRRLVALGVIELVAVGVGLYWDFGR
jgi:hypothetical protein